MKQFSIRDLLWLTLVVAILLVWWIDHRNLETRNRFTVRTVGADGEPSVLLDNQQPGVALFLEDGVWKVADFTTDRRWVAKWNSESATTTNKNFPSAH